MSAPALAAERLAAAELPALAAMLAEAALPSADVASAPGAFFRFRDESGAVIGYAGLEIHGGDALLRSVLVRAPLRRRGFGRAIVARMRDEAAARGVRRLFLLTTTAREFFAALGFAPIERGDVPRHIRATAEFTTFCPAEAQCMATAIG